MLHFAGQYTCYRHRERVQHAPQPTISKNEHRSYPYAIIVSQIDSACIFEIYVLFLEFLMIIGVK